MTANFQPLTYALNLTAGTGGSVTGSGNFTHGQTPIITATAATGFVFSSWSGDGIVNPASASTTVNMTQARSVSASFVPATYALSLTAGTGGSVSGAGIYNHGSTPTITATPNIGYSFSTWSGSGVTNPSNQTTTASMTQTRDISAVSLFYLTH